jgi:general secretion pathway protein C
MATLVIPPQAIRHIQRAGKSRALITAINGALILLLAWMAATTTWTLLRGGPQPGDEQIPVLPSSAPAAKRVRFEPSQIAAWHLFGEASQAEKTPVQVPVDAPDTSLQLTLSGVLASDDPEGARAIVADARREEKHYAIGDPLPGGARLSEIHADRIILERSGRFETLRLPKDTNAGAVNVGYTAPGNSVESNSGLEAAINRSKALQRYRQELSSRPASFMNYVRATPAREAGRFVGFRLQPGREPGVLDELGLQPGDVVTTINGVQIDNPATGMKAMRELSDDQEISVTLLRDGEEISLNFRLPSSDQPK